MDWVLFKDWIIVHYDIVRQEQTLILKKIKQKIFQIILNTRLKYIHFLKTGCGVKVGAPKKPNLPQKPLICAIILGIRRQNYLWQKGSSVGSYSKRVGLNLMKKWQSMTRITSVLLRVSLTFIDSWLFSKLYSFLLRSMRFIHKPLSIHTASEC